MLDNLRDWLYAPEGINVAIFYVINGLSDNAFLQKMMIFLSAIGKYKIFPIYLLMFCGLAWFYGKEVKQKNPLLFPEYRQKMFYTAILLIISYFLYIMWVFQLKTYFGYPRPFVALPIGTVFLPISPPVENPFETFPSGHSAFSMMMLLCFWSILNKYAKVVGIILLMGIGVSRIYLGVHFPSDVVISWGITCLVVYLTKRILSSVWHKKIR